MQEKKTKKEDLRNKQGLFFQVGMLVALALVFVSFQWSVDEKNTTVLTGNTQFDYDEVLIPVTRDNKKKQEVAPKIQAEKLVIMEDDDPIDEDIFEIDVEATEETRVPEIIMEDEPEVVENEIFTIVEEMPMFPGGPQALLSYLSNNTKYPEIAKENGIQGKIFIAFVINKKGEVEQVKLARGVDPLLNEEALRVVRSMPNWKPGKQLNKVVNVAYNVPINFKLN